MCSPYNRTDYLERRRLMISWWSEHIDETRKRKLSITGSLVPSLKSGNLVELVKVSS